MNQDIQEVGREVHGLDCTVLVQDRKIRRAMYKCGTEPPASIKHWKILN